MRGEVMNSPKGRKRKRFNTFGAVFLFFSFLLSCCASVNNLPEARKDGHMNVIKDVPFYPQEDYQCGPSSLAALLNYRGIPVTPEDVAKDIYSRSARGTLSMDMVLYAGRKGLDVSQYSGGLDDLRKKIDSGHPLIVLVDYGFSIFQANHFMVIIGYDDDSVIVNSGRHEKKVIPLKNLVKSWERTKYWTLLIKK